MADVMDSLEDIIERSQIDELASKRFNDEGDNADTRRGGGGGGGGDNNAHNSDYDSEDNGNEHEELRRELGLIFGDDDEENEDDGISGDDTGHNAHEDYLEEARHENEAHIDARTKSTWSAVARTMDANNSKRRRAQTESEEEEANGISLDESSDDRRRASNLRVVSATGKDMGNYMPKTSLTLEEAYRRVNPLPKPPEAMTKRREPPPKSGGVSKSSEKSARLQHDEDAADGGDNNENNEETDSLFKVCGVQMTAEIRSKLQLLSGKKRSRDDENYTESSSTDPFHNHSHKRSFIDEDMTSPESDLEYMRIQFADMLNDSNITAEQMRDTFCPLCGFGNLANEGTVIAGVYSQTNDMARMGAQGDHATMALIISEFWNSNLYRPMRKMGKRCMPFTYSMAFNHLHQPHRLEPANDHQKDIRRIIMKQDILDNMIFQVEPLSGKLMYDPKAFSMSMACTRSKNILRKTQPEKMAFYSAPNDKLVTDLASHNVNPFRNVSLSYRQAPSAPGVRQSGNGKTGSTSLGGRRK